MAKQDAEEVKEILDVVSDKVPKLLNDISDALFNVEKAEKFGMSVANFYKAMKEAGMDDEKAFELTQKYMESQSMGSVIQQALGGAVGGGGHHHAHAHAKTKKKIRIEGKDGGKIIINGDDDDEDDEPCCEPVKAGEDE